MLIYFSLCCVLQSVDKRWADFSDVTHGLPEYLTLFCRLTCLYQPVLLQVFNPGICEVYYLTYSPPVTSFLTNLHLLVGYFTLLTACVYMCTLSQHTTNTFDNSCISPDVQLSRSCPVVESVWNERVRLDLYKPSSLLNKLPARVLHHSLV